MKRFTSILIVLAIVSCMAFAAGSDNYQKIYAVDDPVYGYISSLYLLEGYAMPSTTGPWSGSELSAMLDYIDSTTLSGVSRNLYDIARTTLDADAADPVYKAALEIDEEIYLNSNTSEAHFQGWDNWRYGWANSNAFLNFINDHHLGENFYGYFDFSVGVAKDHTTKKLGDSTLWTNTPMLLQNDMKQLDFSIPYRAFVAAGGDNWSVFFGRERLSWGNGTTGNFIIGDHLKYHNALRFTTYEGSFKYTFLVSAFPHPQMYYEVIDNDGNMKPALNGTGHGQSQYMNGISCFIGHRLEWRILKNLNFTLTEGVMYMSKDNKIDLIAFSPAYLYHNNYTRGNTNSILALEADWSFAKGWDVYGQMTIDEFCLPGEANPATTKGTKAEPNAAGFLAGLKYATGLGDGILTANVEGAYTTPYLYLRDGDTQAGETPREQTPGRYGINFVVALRDMSNTGGTQNYNLDFLGYKYGGDAIVGNLNVEYVVPQKWTASTNLFYMQHGTHDMHTVWTRITNTSPDKMNQKAPTTHHQTANNMDPNANLRDSVATTFVAGISGAYQLPYGFSVGGQLDYIMIKNPGNISANATISDVQATVLLSYRLN
ncbi:MAG: hypothetical protein MJ057_02365 [Sphaerochaetaceae bacterium]|nr:hypothetical protein [Sphaerochaetaceae bacterium]